MVNKQCCVFLCYIQANFRITRTIKTRWRSVMKNKWFSLHNTTMYYYSKHDRPAVYENNKLKKSTRVQICKCYHHHLSLLCETVDCLYRWCCIIALSVGLEYWKNSETLIYPAPGLMSNAGISSAAAIIHRNYCNCIFALQHRENAPFNICSECVWQRQGAITNRLLAATNWHL